MGEREAIARQVREYEQTFDSLGYTLLDQIMPATGVSNVFRIVQAADEFKARLKKKIGRPVELDGKAVPLDSHHLEALSRYSLSHRHAAGHRRACATSWRASSSARTCKSLYGYVEAPHRRSA